MVITTMTTTSTAAANHCCCYGVASVDDVNPASPTFYYATIAHNVLAHDVMEDFVINSRAAPAADTTSAAAAGIAACQDLGQNTLSGVHLGLVLGRGCMPGGCVDLYDASGH